MVDIVDLVQIVFDLLEIESENSRISLVFDIKHSLTREVTPMPASPEEEHLAFLWAHRNELKAYNLLPKPLINWFQESEAKGWASTIE